ncbi:MAG: metalloregulator ArsR/SmtB family transcription factor [Pseudodesulfovibrio sp.]|nr:metalloregulator ArsR/SmtB family transcription factor [Pseudodesulfovibrio sp.]MDD3313040.1 metalloregulator ArsR/SmtB family transcription factor [Pseudodesulfovibrio sp.]
MERLANRLKGLGDPTRLRALALLAGGELCVCHLMAALELPQSTVSRHMAFLRRGGWVENRRRGKWVYYALSEPGEGVLAQAMDLLRRELPRTETARADMARLDEQKKNGTACPCE